MYPTLFVLWSIVRISFSTPGGNDVKFVCFSLFVEKNFNSDFYFIDYSIHTCDIWLTLFIVITEAGECQNIPDSRFESCFNTDYCDAIDCPSLDMLDDSSPHPVIPDLCEVVSFSIHLLF